MRDRWRYKDIIFLLILLFEDAGTFNVFPIGIAQILLLILGGLLIEEKRYTGLFLDKRIIFLLSYMVLITITHHFDIDTITGFSLFAIEIVILYWYISTFDNFNKMFSLIYKAALIISIIGILQELGYMFNISMLTDMTKYGFPRESVYAAGGIFARVSSLYSEPASLCPLLACSFFIGLVGDKDIGVTKLKNIVIILFSIFTQSSVVYLAIGLVVVIYATFADISLRNKYLIISIAVFSCTALLLGNFDFMKGIFAKLATLKTASSQNTNDLSAFALISNLKISFAKIKDGYYLGTGFNSHRFYYENYIKQFYTTIYMKLNYIDAASMYTRTISEFGIVGILFLCTGLIKSFYSAVKNKNNVLLVCSIALSCAFVRDGNYNRILSLSLFLIVFFIRKSEKMEISDYE